jgi:hypothetical protein
VFKGKEQMSYRWPFLNVHNTQPYNQWIHATFNPALQGIHIFYIQIQHVHEENKVQVAPCRLMAQYNVDIEFWGGGGYV